MAESAKVPSSIVTMEQLVLWEFENGYIDRKGAPIKCMECGSTDCDDVVTSREEYVTVEMDRVCKGCGNIMGSWAYGNWVS